MRTIRFKVEQQRIKNMDSICHIYSGTNNYLNLKFEFGEEWDGCAKVISFGKDQELKAMLLKDDNSCLVPIEAFDIASLSFYIIGGRKDGYRVRTQPFIIPLGG